MKKNIFIILTSIASTIIMNAETKTAIKPSELHPLILNDIQKIIWDILFLKHLK